MSGNTGSRWCRKSQRRPGVRGGHVMIKWGFPGRGAAGHHKRAPVPDPHLTPSIRINWSKMSTHGHGVARLSLLGLLL